MSKSYTLIRDGLFALLLVVMIVLAVRQSQELREELRHTQTKAEQAKEEAEAATYDGVKNNVDVYESLILMRREQKQIIEILQMMANMQSAQNDLIFQSDTKSR